MHVVFLTNADNTLSRLLSAKAHRQGAQRSTQVYRRHWQRMVSLDLATNKCSACKTKGCCHPKNAKTRGKDTAKGWCTVSRRSAKGGRKTKGGSPRPCQGTAGQEKPAM